MLPFRNLSKDPAHDFLGDLLAEDVIGHLSRLTDLFVISRLSTTPFRDRLYEPRNVAEVLGVRYVLTGSMLAAGSQLQVIAELTEADVGRAIWSERFRGSMADIFELQEALATDIAKRVVPYVRQLELQRARSKRPENLTAYERTLRAIDHLHGSRAGTWKRRGSCSRRPLPRIRRTPLLGSQGKRRQVRRSAEGVKRTDGRRPDGDRVPILHEALRR